MNDRDPIVLRRILALRQFPMFAGSTLAELAVIAENATDQTLAIGAAVGAPEYRRRAVHFVVHGRLETCDASWGARDACGILEALAHRSPPPAIAATQARTLQLEAADLDDILEDNFGLLRAALRDLAARVVALGPRGRAASAGPPIAHGAPLGLVERVIVLRQLAPFATARLLPLSMLARAATEVSWPAGTIVARATEPANRIMVVLDGRLRATAARGARFLLGPGEAIGALETIGALSHDATIECLEAARALEISGERLLDILEDHTDLALSIVSTFAQLLLDAPAHGAMLS